MTETVYTLAEAYKEFVTPELRREIIEANRKMKSAPTMQIIRQGEASDESWSHAQGEVDRLVRRATAQVVLKLKSGELLMRAYPADRPYQGEPITFPKVAWNDVVVFRWQNNKISLGGTEFSGVELVHGMEIAGNDPSPDQVALPGKRKGPGPPSFKNEIRKIYCERRSAGIKGENKTAEAEALSAEYDRRLQSGQIKRDPRYKSLHKAPSKKSVLRYMSEFEKEKKNK